VGGMACDAYYADLYRQCSDVAYADNTACINDCASIGYPEGCQDQCEIETNNALDSCQYSYRGYWNCGYPAVWPPVGVVIEIP
jgi:hypothetical protein